MTVKFRKLDKFDGNDFRGWQKKMHFLLITLKVVYVLSTPMPEFVDDKTLEQTRKRCKFVIEQYHELFRILRQFTQHGGLNTDEFISVSSIIDKLPPSWKDFKHNLKYNKDELSLVQLGSHFRIEKTLRAKESGNRKGKEIVGSPSVNMIEDDKNKNNNKNNKAKKKKNDGNIDGSNKKSKLTCWKYGKTSHFKKDCHVKKNKGGNTSSLGQGSKDPNSSQDKALDKFKIYKTKVELPQNDLIKTLRADRGGECYDPLYFQSVGIIHETTALYTPQQTDVSERKNRALKEIVNSMLSYSGRVVDQLKYTSNPSIHHWHAIMRVFKFLKKTVDYGLSYVGFPSVLEGYSDAGLCKDMTVKFRKLDKFNGDDFRHWQKKMHFLLTTLKVVYVLSTPMPDFVKDEMMEQTRKRCKAEESGNEKGKEIAGSSSVNMIEDDENKNNNKNNNAKKRKKGGNNDGLNYKSKLTCWKYGKTGHFKKDCRVKKNNGGNTSSTGQGSKDPNSSQGLDFDFDVIPFNHYVSYISEICYVHDDAFAWWIDSDATCHTGQDQVDKTKELLSSNFSMKDMGEAFGVLVLEMVMGQKNTSFRNGESIEDLLSFAWKTWRNEETLREEESGNEKGKEIDVSPSVNMIEDDKNKNNNKNNKAKKKKNDGNNDRSNKKSKLTCWKYSKTGHFKKDCHVKKNNGGNTLLTIGS
uniref:Zinc finger, CCHC-type n=1 Tax=Tanacetum cinerariifolium TaxID=118510 RepID=A0A699H4S8_TANCI|nr:zinc finger, CCHC-type [Tanacetum cinerariifolium]